MGSHGVAACALTVVLLGASTARAQGLDGPWSAPEAPLTTVSDDQVNALYENLVDLERGDDGHVDLGTALPLPRAAKLAALAAFEARREKAWGRSVTNLTAADFPSPAVFQAFAVQKALILTRYGRTPSQVTDFFVTASGTVEGKPVAPHRLFGQTWEGVGKPSKLVAAMFPGYLNTGRHFAFQAAALSDQGVSVSVMDQQWAGHTEGGRRGGVASGESVARDAYAFAGYVHGMNPDRTLFLVGHSLGAGPATLGALTFGHQGLIDAEVTDAKGNTFKGTTLLPPATPGVAQSPYLRMTKSAANVFLSEVEDLPVIAAIRSFELPLAIRDKFSHAYEDTIGVEEGVMAQADQALNAVLPFTARVVGKIVDGNGPLGPLLLVHSLRDTLADFGASATIAASQERQGKPYRLIPVDSDDHGIPSQWQYGLQFLRFLPALEKLARGEPLVASDLGASPAVPNVAPPRSPAKILGDVLAGAERFLTGAPPPAPKATDQAEGDRAGGKILASLRGDPSILEALGGPDAAAKSRAILARALSRGPRPAESAGLAGVLKDRVDDGRTAGSDPGKR